MNIEKLRRIPNKNVAQQNELSYLEMKACSLSLKEYPWVLDVLRKNGESENTGILIRLSDTPDQGGIDWYGSWLSLEGKFYEFEVLTDWESNQVLEYESWGEIFPEINGRKKGIGKTEGFIALELLSETNQKLTRQ